jgi:hypothetical protein
VIVAEARRDLSAARGLARAALSAAETAADRARRDRDTCRATHDERLARLAAAREASRREIARSYRERAIGLGRELDALAMRCAPGAAGAAWRTWRPNWPAPGRETGGRATASEPTPAALLRIGAIHVERDLPALVPLLDRAHLSLSGPGPVVDGVIAGVLLRTLGSAAPGQVRLTVYDPERLGGSLAGFSPLGGAGLLTIVGPGGLGPMLDEHVEHVRRINESVLTGGHASLAELAEATGRPRPEPWRIAVLLGDAATATELGGPHRAQVERLLRTGVPCGVHLVGRGLPDSDHPDVCRVAVRGVATAGDPAATAGDPAAGAREAATAICATTGDLPVRLDPPPPGDRVTAACREAAERVLAGPPPAALEDLEPDKPWCESSATGLTAPLGDGPDGHLVAVTLGDDPPHALIAGPSGTGKTNLLYAWLAGLCARYSPDELALYLLDFSEATSFARFAPSPRDPTWLPQARVVGVNLRTDPRHGVTALRHLAGELRRRARAARRHEATKLAELRAEDPDGHWPRVVAVIDEFQALFAGRDDQAAEAAALLEDLARRGRSQGIHLVLSSQDVAGVAAFWQRPALVAQFTLRIALPKARRVLADTNLAADVIPRFHAVLNADSGVDGANLVVRLPDAGDREAWRRLQRKLWDARPSALAPPRLLDGDAGAPGATDTRPRPPAQDERGAGRRSGVAS